MSCERTYECLDFNEWFERFLTVHPQLQYFQDEQKLLELQEILSQKYKEKIYTREETINIYNNYVEKKREQDILYYDKEFEVKQFLKRYKKNTKQNIDNFIDKLIKEL